MRFCLLIFCCLFPLSVGLANPLSYVLIDAGHGGKDSGGRGNGLIEKNLTLDTALRLAARLKQAGLRAVLLRDADYFIELDGRVAIANRYLGRDAVLVSIHYNAVGSSAPHGVETFFWRPDSGALAARIQRSVAQSAGLLDLGVNRRRIRLTRNPSIPCVLIEGGYMTNPREARRLASANTREAIARGITAGLLEWRAKGQAGIRRVPEIPSRPSRGSDPRSGGTRLRLW